MAARIPPPAAMPRVTSITWYQVRWCPAGMTHFVLSTRCQGQQCCSQFAQQPWHALQVVHAVPQPHARLQLRYQAPATQDTRLCQGEASACSQDTHSCTTDWAVPVHVEITCSPCKQTNSARKRTVLLGYGNIHYSQGPVMSICCT